MNFLPAQFKLLSQRRFAPLFGVQFGGALNDNVLRNVVVAMLTFGAFSDVGGASRSLLVQAALGLFILPFFLLSASAGRLADGCPDRRLAIRVIKAVEIVTMLVAAVGLMVGNIWLLLLAVCLAGVQSAYFGPFKYALLPLLLARGELIAGNGLLSASTYLAILLGILWGTELGTTDDQPLVVIGILLAIAVAGFACTLWFPAVLGPVGSSWRQAWSWNFLGDTWIALRALVRSPPVATLVMFISWFWATGSIITAQLPIYVRDVAAHDHVTYLFLLLLVCAGIAAGSLSVITLLRTGVTTRWVPAGMAASALPLFFLPVGTAVPSLAASGELGTLADFLATGQAWGVGAVLISTAVGMGFYIVPLYAALQLAAPPDRRGQAIAANNIVNSLMIVAGVLLAGTLLGANETIAAAMSQLFVILGGLTLALAAVAWKVLPEIPRD